MIKRMGISVILVAAFVGSVRPGLADVPKPLKVLAVMDAGWRTDFHPRMQTVSFYDVTDLSGTDVLNDTPMFSVWLGYEQTGAVDETDNQAIAVNPVNGTVYVLEHDNGTGGADSDADGDTDGDYDVYRIDYQRILKDFLDNSVNPGTVYAPSQSADGIPYGTAWTNTGPIPHPGGFPTRYAEGFTGSATSAIEKVGEVARNGDMTGLVYNYAGGTHSNDGSGYCSGNCVYHEPDLDFVSPEMLLVLDDSNYKAGGSAAPAGDPTFWYSDPLNPTQDELEKEAEADHRIIALERVDTTSGQATHDGTETAAREGGYNLQTTESWETRDLGPINLDGIVPVDVYVPQGMSEPIDMQYVTRSQEGGNDPNPPGGTETIEGVWVVENDTPGQTGDDGAFLKINAWDGGADDIEYNGGFVADETSSTADNNGDADWIKVDKDGGTVMGESGYYNTPQHEPAVITRGVLDYDYLFASGDEEVWMGTDQAAHGPIAPTLSDDANIVDGRFVALDIGTENVFYLDVDGSPDYVADVYVFDLGTDTLVYEEIDAINLYLEQHGIEFLMRGDLDGDGDVDKDDVDALKALLADAGTTALEKEANDLTSDNDLTTADKDELVENIMGTAYADLDLDGDVDGQDFLTFSVCYNGSLKPAQGTCQNTDADLDKDGDVDGQDFLTFSTCYNGSLNPNRCP